MRQLERRVDVPHGGGAVCGIRSLHAEGLERMEDGPRHQARHLRLRGELSIHFSPSHACPFSLLLSCMDHGELTLASNNPMQGVIASGLTLMVMSWCISLKGPLFASVFNPLMLVIVAVLGSFLLDEKLHLGR